MQTEAADTRLLARQADNALEFQRESPARRYPPFSRYQRVASSTSPSASELNETRTNQRAFSIMASRRANTSSAGIQTVSGLHIRHPPGDLFVPSLGDSFRRIFGRAFQADNQAMDQLAAFFRR